MSEYDLPFHIQEEIMKRLPVKSLIQFRSVSKAWKSLINNSKFIDAHCARRHTHQQHLLLPYGDPTYVCYVDDGTFPQHRSLTSLPPSIKQLIQTKVVGSSHGLLCLYGYQLDIQTRIVVIWNPSIRKSLFIHVPNNQQYVGFGVCPVTNDTKIVAITQSWDVKNIETSYHCKVMVYTLSSGKWKSLSSNLPTKPIREQCLVVTDRFIYWRAELINHNMIISFDLTNESFESIDLPDDLARHKPMDLHISKLKDYLAVLQFTENICVVWIMEHSVQISFTKLFTIEAPHRIVGFRKSGVPIMQVRNVDHVPCKFVVYEPNSKHNNVLEVSGPFSSFDVHSYMETLLFLGRSRCKSY